MADDLSAQGSGLRARQTKRSPHAPENITPTPTVNLRVDIHFLAQGLEEGGSLLGGDWFVLKIPPRVGSISRFFLRNNRWIAGRGAVDE